MAKKKNPAFDFSSLNFNLDLDLDLNLGQSESEFVKSAKLSFEPVAFDNAQRMAEEIDLTQDYFAFVSGKFIFGDFIEALCYVHGLHPEAVYLTTLGMGKNNVDSIVNLVDYLGAGKVNLIVSNYFISVERRKLVPYMVQEFSGRPIDVAVLASHCKICLVECEAGKIIIAGSANLSSSNNVEQFHVFHDDALFDWLRGRLDDVMERFTVIKGSTSETIFENNKCNLSKQAFQILGDDSKWQTGAPDGTEREAAEGETAPKAAEEHCTE